LLYITVTQTIELTCEPFFHWTQIFKASKISKNFKISKISKKFKGGRGVKKLQLGNKIKYGTTFYF
jgi:hypothetical protein